MKNYIQTQIYPSAMSALEFPCDKCKKEFGYKQLMDHDCGANDDIEVVSVVEKKRHFNSMGLSMWDGTNKKKKKSRSPKKEEVEIIHVETKQEPEEGLKSGRVSAREAAKLLGLSMGSQNSSMQEELHDKGNFKIEDVHVKYYNKLDHLLDERTVEIKKLKYDSGFPLYEVLKPRQLSDYCGHKDLVGENGIISKWIYTGVIPSMIFWGEPGIGKTTLVRLILNEIKNSPLSKHYQIYEYSAVSCGLSDLKAIYNKYLKLRRNNHEIKMIVFLDEIHRFNKLQQDYFLKLIENNDLIFFGCTTENPSYKINDALLSRCQLFNLGQPTADDILVVINKAVLYINKARILLHKQQPILLFNDAKKYLAEVCQGDYRLAYKTLESLCSNYSQYLTQQQQLELLQTKELLWDPEKASGNKITVNSEQLKSFLKHTLISGAATRVELEDVFSAMRKSIVGSDANAALIYLALLFQYKTDPLEIVNFLQVILMDELDESSAAGPSLLEFLNATYYTVTKLGLPECDLAIVQLIYRLCEAPKSARIQNTARNLDSFLTDNPSAQSLPIPMHIRNAPTDLMKDMGYGTGYKYNPTYKDGEVNQRYLPRGIRKKVFLSTSQFGEKKID